MSSFYVLIRFVGWMEERNTSPFVLISLLSLSSCDVRACLPIDARFKGPDCSDARLSCKEICCKSCHL
jgi:hypothetical protein